MFHTAIKNTVTCTILFLTTSFTANIQVPAAIVYLMNSKIWHMKWP